LFDNNYAFEALVDGGDGFDIALVSPRHARPQLRVGPVALARNLELEAHRPRQNRGGSAGRLTVAILGGDGGDAIEFHGAFGMNWAGALTLDMDGGAGGAVKATEVSVVGLQRLTGLRSR
jgi:hypothetical protein